MLHTVKQEAVEMKEINIPVGISDFKEICKAPVRGKGHAERICTV